MPSSDLKSAAELALTTLDLIKTFYKLPPSDLGLVEKSMDHLKLALNPNSPSRHKEHAET